jgi:hypothetical protein
LSGVVGEIRYRRQARLLLPNKIREISKLVLLDPLTEANRIDVDPGLVNGASDDSNLSVKPELLSLF